MSRRWAFLLLLLSTLVPPSAARRGGGLGMGRGSSGARMGGSRMGGSRAGGGGSGGLFSGGARSSGGTFGGHKQPGGGGFVGTNNMGRKQGGQGFGQSSFGGQRPHDTRGKGLFGRSGGGSFGRPRYTKSGTGSFLRSNQFKNMIVGAAAGYLTYQAGKHIIRSIAAPMMWNNRPYYWGQSYYQPRHGNSNMCRRPIDPTDEQFGGIYNPDGVSRPHEIVWGCSPYEVCCGLECCRGGDGHGLSVGYALLAVSLARALL